MPNLAVQSLGVYPEWTVRSISPQEHTFDQYPAITRKQCDIGYKLVLLTPSMPAVPNLCRSKDSVQYWSNPPFLIFDIWTLQRSGLSTRAPECQKLKMVGQTSMAKSIALTGSAVKGLNTVCCIYKLLHELSLLSNIVFCCFLSQQSRECCFSKSSVLSKVTDTSQSTHSTSCSFNALYGCYQWILCCVMCKSKKKQHKLCLFVQ